MTLINSQIESGFQSGNYTHSWRSLQDLAFLETPQKYMEIMYASGRRFQGLDFFNLYGNRLNVKNRALDVIVKGKLNEPIRVEEIVAPAAPGDDILITLLPDEYDASGNCRLRLKFLIAVPVGSSFELYRAQARAGNPGINEVFTCSPLNADAFFDDNIAEGSELMVGASADTTGGNGVEGMKERLYQYTYRTQISKERIGWEGGEIAKEEYEDIIKGGQIVGKYARWLNATEHRLDKQIEATLWMGQNNTNNVLEQSFFGAGNQAVLAANGIVKTMEDRGAMLYYGTEFDINDLYSIKPHFHNTELTTDMGVILADSWLMRDLELSGVEFINDGGSAEWQRILRNVWGSMTNDAINISFRAAYVDGILTTFIEVPSLSDPATFGASSLAAMRGQGLYVPIETANVQLGLDLAPIKLKNLSIGYLNNNGENRTRVIAKLNGTSGTDYTPVNSLDGMNIHLLSEYMPIIINPEQMILLRRGDAPVVGS